MTSLLSGRVVKTPSAELDSDRDQFLELSQAESSLGDPSATGLVLTSTINGQRSWSALGDLSNPLQSSSIPLGLTFPVSTNPLASADPATVAAALVIIDSVLASLRPLPPNNFPNQDLTVTSVGIDPLAANGAIPNSSGSVPPISAGSSVTRVVDATASSDWIGLGDNVGPGNSGTLDAVVNGQISGEVVLTNANNNGVYGNLEIADNLPYPVTTPGFWQTFRSRITAASVMPGWNRFQITDTATDATDTNEVWFIKDNLTDVPVIAGGSISESSGITKIYSSGVWHYGSGSVLQISGTTMTNIAGETYRSDPPINIVATNSICQPQSINYSDVGIATPVARQTLGPVSLTSTVVALNGIDIHNRGIISVTANNVNGNSNTININTIVLVMLGNHGNRVSELQIPGTNANGARTYLGATATGDTPSLSLPGGPAIWDSSIDLTATGYEHEAAVVGGQLSADQTNYTTGYLPATTVNYSSKPAAQYMSWVFTRSALNNFVLNITGTYSGLWIGLPGISDNHTISPNALGGTWWNAMAYYSGAGVPGHTNDVTAGCAVGAISTGTSGPVNITFGSQNSINSTNNCIIVRIKLTAGQTVSSLSMAN